MAQSKQKKLKAKQTKKVKKIRKLSSKKKPSKHSGSILQLKTDEQKDILEEYYEKYPQSWSRSDIKMISQRTRLTEQQVYKYLWNLRNKDSKKKKIANKKNESPIPPPFRMLEISRNNFISIPETLKFAHTFYFLESQKVPLPTINLLKRFGKTLTINVPFFEDTQQQ